MEVALLLSAPLGICELDMQQERCKGTSLYVIATSLASPTLWRYPGPAGPVTGPHQTS